MILSNGWHPRWLTMAYVIKTCAKYPLQQNWKKIFFRVSEVLFNLPRFNPRLKHLCVTFMHFKKVTKKISQNRLKISCVNSSENRLGNSSSHQQRVTDDMNNCAERTRRSLWNEYFYTGGRFRIEYLALDLSLSAPYFSEKKSDPTTTCEGSCTEGVIMALCVKQELRL